MVSIKRSSHADIALPKVHDATVHIFINRNDG
jgi:hypothetical protein